MTSEQKFLLKLISYSQFGFEPDCGKDAANSVPEGIDFNRLFDEAVAQSVVCVAGSVLPDCVPDDMKKRWKDADNRQLVSYIRYINAQRSLTSLLRENGIPFAVLKGLSAAIYYRDPSKRAMGDIDFIVPQKSFEFVKELMIRAGYDLKNKDQNYKRVTVFSMNGVYFELHHHFDHEDREDIEKYVTEGFSRLREACVDMVDFSTLDRLGNGIVLLDHMRNHLKSGLGLRQAIDWMMYVDHELDDSFWGAEFEAVVKEVRLEKFAKVATKMCQKYMGLRTNEITWCSDAEDNLCEDLMENLLISGNFGRRNGDGQKIENVTASFKRDGLFKRLQSAGESNWRLYKEHRWLKPFCWIYQSCRYARQGIRTKRNGDQLRDDLKRAKKRNKLLKDLEII